MVVIIICNVPIYLNIYTVSPFYRPHPSCLNCQICFPYSVSFLQSHALVSYDLEDDVLKNKKESGGNGNVTSLRFSRDGSHLVSTDSLKSVRLFKPHSQGGFRVCFQHNYILQTFTYAIASIVTPGKRNYSQMLPYRYS